MKFNALIHNTYRYCIFSSTHLFCLQDLSREVKKLRAALEQQQDAHLARLAAKDSEWKEKLARHADKVTSYIYSEFF